MKDILAELGTLGIVPAAVIDDAGDAVKLGQALLAGDLPCVEVTFRTEAAEESIRRLARELPEILVGAGTVVTVEQAKRAVQAGAGFIVSPGLDTEVVRYCLDNAVPVVPGVSSSTEIQAASRFGLKVLKFFPAEALGGPKMLKAVSAPFSSVRFIPTGGVTAANLLEYLSLPCVFACGGSWMVKRDLVRSGNYTEITRLSREAVGVMLGFKPVRIDLAESGGDAARVLRLLDFMGCADPGISFENQGEKAGTKGRIAFRTNSIARAIGYLERKGFVVDMDSAEYARGAIKSVCLRGEIAGFVWQLCRE